MAYLLILPVFIYICLAVAIWLRQPHGTPNRILSIYFVGCAAVTSGYLIIGTTSDRQIAEITTVSTVLLDSWLYLAIVPLLLLGLYFENWFERVRRRVWLFVAGFMGIVSGILLWSFISSDGPLVYPVEMGFWLGWALRPIAESWLLAAGAVLVSQLPVIIIIGIAIYYKRADFWHSAIPFLIAAVLSILIPILAVLGGETWCLTITGFGSCIPALLLGILVLRSQLDISANSINTHLKDPSAGAVIINDHQRALWHNIQMERWIDSHRPGMMFPLHLDDLLGGTPLKNAVHWMLDNKSVEDDCVIKLNGEEYIIQIQIQPFSLRHVPNASLLTFHDITASRIRRDLDERRHDLLALSLVSADIFSSLEAEQVISRALDHILAITRLDNAVVYLGDEADPEFLKLGGGLLKSLDGAAPDKLPLANTIAGQTIKTQQVVIISNTEQSAQNMLWAERGMLSALSIPLIARARAIGVLQVGSIHLHEFDVVEIALLESIGRQLAIAIDNARLHSAERRQRQVAEALRAVASMVSTKQLDEVLSLILKQMAGLLEYTGATVMLLAEPGKLSVRAYAGFEFKPEQGDPRDIRVEVAQFPYLLNLFTQRTTQLVLDTNRDPSWTKGQANHGAWIGSPLIVREQVVGCLSVNHNEPDHLTAIDQQIVDAFAGQIAVAVENAQLFESEQRRRVQAERLQQASYDLVTRPNLDGALSAALENLATLLQFDRASIGLLDPATQTWTPRAGFPIRHFHTPIPLSEYPLFERLIDEKRVIMVPETRQNVWWRPGRYAPREIRCWMGVPLIVRDRVIGVLNVDSFQPHRFSDEELQVVRLFSNQIAAAIENFRLIEEASRQNKALRALNTVLAASNEALTQENLLIVSLERVLEMLNLRGGTIHQRDIQHQELVLRASAGIVPAPLLARLKRIPLGQALPFAEGLDINVFSVPLVSHGTEIGLLSVFHPHDQPIEEDLQRLLANIGQQLGVVMDNAVMFEDAVRREALSTDLGRLSLAISAQLDRTTVLNLICHESRAVFNAQGAYLWLLDDKMLVGAAAVGPGADKFVGSTMSLNDTRLLPARVIQDRRPRYINRINENGGLDLEFLDGAHPCSVMALPLLKADVPLGSLLLVNTENPEAFAEWLIDQVGLLGVQAALAIQNVTLFDEIRRRLDQLRLVNEVGRYATAILSLQSLIEGVARKLGSILHYDVISLLQVEEDYLHIQSIFVNGNSLPPDQMPERYTPLEGVAGQSVRRAEPVLENRPRYIPNHLEKDGKPVDCSSLAVPLIIADEVIGVLLVERQGTHTITQDDLDVLEPLAAQLAISVSNARLFEKVRQQTVELEARVIERTTEIRQQQERTEAILRSVADAVIVFDLAGQVIDTNPAAKELFDQYDLQMDLGSRTRQLVERTLDAEAGADSTEIIELGPVALQAKAARVVEGERVMGSVVSLRDISRLQELDRMKDMFVSNVSHELRTPLANLKLYLSLLQQGRPERRASYLEVMEREVERLARLIADLLDLSRLQSEHRAERALVRQLIDLEAMINTLIHDNAAWAESKHNELYHECLSSPLPKIVGNPDQMIRAIGNLVSNAINYTPDGGRIKVSSQVYPEKPARPEWVIIEVADTGIGIPASELPKIFERFYRGSNVNLNTPGTGLGLAIIKEIVELHEGQISVESQVDLGSTFRIKLPVINLRE